MKTLHNAARVTRVIPAASAGAGRFELAILSGSLPFGPGALEPARGLGLRAAKGVFG